MEDIITQCLSFSSMNLMRQIDLAPAFIDLPISHDGDRSSMIRGTEFGANRQTNKMRHSFILPPTVKRNASESKQQFSSRFNIDYSTNRNAQSYIQGPREPKVGGSFMSSEPSTKESNIQIGSENKRIVVPSLFKNPNLCRKQSNMGGNQLLFSQTTKYQDNTDDSMQKQEIDKNWGKKNKNLLQKQNSFQFSAKFVE